MIFRSPLGILRLSQPDEKHSLQPTQDLPWGLLMQRSSAPLWAFSGCRPILLTLSLMLSPTALEENNFSYVHLLFYFFWSLPKPHECSWGLERRLAGRSEALPSGLCLSSSHKSRSSCCMYAPLHLHFWTRCQDVWCFFSSDPWSQILRCWL